MNLIFISQLLMKEIIWKQIMIVINNIDFAKVENNDWYFYLIFLWSIPNLLFVFPIHLLQKILSHKKNSDQQFIK